MRIVLAALVSALWSASALSGWGLQSGRATIDDAVSLTTDEAQLQLTVSRFQRAMVESEMRERRNQLLGIADGEVRTPGESYTRVVAWWEGNVLKPVAEIVSNPAASCAEARKGLADYFGMQRQRALLGLTHEDGDNTPEGSAKAQEDARLNTIGESLEQASRTRCHEEAADECFATGRYMAVHQQVLAEARQDALLGKAPDRHWASDALAKCAIYELRFSSTTSVSGSARVDYEITLEGTVKMVYEPAPDADDPNEMNIYIHGQLTGISEGHYNPFTLSLRCTPPPRGSVACGPQISNMYPLHASISELDLVHPVYSVNDEWRVSERSVGENDLKFDFMPGPMFVPYALTIGTRRMPFDALPVYDEPFTLVHVIRPGDPRPESFESTKTGVYPTLFEVTPSGSVSVGHTLYRDSTKFELVHKPQPVEFSPRHDPLRTPAH